MKTYRCVTVRCGYGGGEGEMEEEDAMGEPYCCGDYVAIDDLKEALLELVLLGCDERVVKGVFGISGWGN